MNPLWFPSPSSSSSSLPYVVYISVRSLLCLIWKVLYCVYRSTINSLHSLQILGVPRVLLHLYAPLLYTSSFTLNTFMLYTQINPQLSLQKRELSLKQTSRRRSQIRQVRLNLVVGPIHRFPPFFLGASRARHRGRVERELLVRCTKG